MIDVTQPGTFPTEIETSFLRYVNSFPPNIIAEIESRKVENNSDIRCAIENYLNPSHAEPLYEEMLIHFNKSSICCFHATKVLSEHSIRDKGLITNSWEQYSALLKEALEQTELTEKAIKEAIHCVEHEYQRKYCYSQKPQLCFFAPMSAADGGESAEYDQFCQNAGGELARWALRDKMPDAYKALKAIGTPVIVEFELPFSDMANYQKDCIVYSFVTHYFKQMFWKMDCPIEFDGTTEKSVLPSQIINIHLYKEVDYE